MQDILIKAVLRGDNSSNTLTQRLNIEEGRIHYTFAAPNIAVRFKRLGGVIHCFIMRVVKWQPLIPQIVGGYTYT